jgi:hypothetical protein
MRKLIQTAALAAVFMFVANSGFAQSMKDYTWDSYNVKFAIPVTFHVDKSSGEVFEAGDDDVYLSIYPQKGSSVAFSQMKAKLETWASDSKVYDYPKVYELENLNGYWGVYLEGTNSTNSLPALLMLVVHPDYPTKYMYVWINYRKDAISTAEKVLKSFTPTY